MSSKPKQEACLVSQMMSRAALQLKASTKHWLQDFAGMVSTNHIRGVNFFLILLLNNMKFRVLMQGALHFCRSKLLLAQSA
jgi:hypothetical protein